MSEQTIELLPCGYTARCSTRAVGAPLRSCAISTTKSDPMARQKPATPTREKRVAREREGRDQCAIVGHVMKARPISGDFGITDADISQVKEQDGRAERLKGVLKAGGGIIGGSSFVWAGFVVGHFGNGWLVVIGYFALVFTTFLVAGGLTVEIERRLVRLHPKSDPVHRYQQAVMAFEDWWVRTKQITGSGCLDEGLKLN